MNSFQKILLTGMLITLTFPAIFTEKVVTEYHTYKTPRMELFVIPVIFMIIFFICEIWKPKKK